MLKVKGGMPGNIYFINCPKPSAFLYHKGVTFKDRENNANQAKDLYYMYFILRYAKNLYIVLDEIRQYYDKGYFLSEFANIKEYFKKKTSPGCLMVEQENGPDEYIGDVRNDIFNRFNQLIELIQ